MSEMVGPRCLVCGHPVGPGGARGPVPRYCGARCRKRKENRVASMVRRLARLERCLRAWATESELTGGLSMTVPTADGTLPETIVAELKAEIAELRARITALRGGKT